MHDPICIRLKKKSTCFGQLLCPSSGVFHSTHSNGIRNAGLLTACEQDQDQDGDPSWSCSQAVSKPVWHIPLLCVQWKTPDDVQRNCPKHAEFYSENKFQKLVHLVGFIIRIFHDARSSECQTQNVCLRLHAAVLRNTVILIITSVIETSKMHTFYINVLIQL